MISFFFLKKKKKKKEHAYSPYFIFLPLFFSPFFNPSPFHLHLVLHQQCGATLSRSQKYAPTLVRSYPPRVSCISTLTFSNPRHFAIASGSPSSDTGPSCRWYAIGRALGAIITSFLAGSR